MRIALHDAFAGLRHTAEREFARRCVAVLEAMGHAAKILALSDEIVAYDPHIVLVTHELVPKLTAHFTVGVLWSPLVFMRDDAERHRSIRSWDLAVPANAALRQFAEDLYFPLRHRTAITDSAIFPTAPVADVAETDPRSLSLAYVGVHWDGGRHKDLLVALSKVVDLNVYGPPGAWDFLPDHYRGIIPFDGNSLIATLNRHGAVLALHKDTHKADDTPSMRPFEACAARCLVITDRMPTLEAMFGETLHYVDAAGDPERIALEIKALLQAARDAPEAAAARIRDAHAAFAAKASLDHLLPRLVDEVVARMGAAVPRAPAPSLPVTIVVRCGTASLDEIGAAVRTLEAQTYADVAVLFAGARTIECLDALIEGLREAGRFASVAFVAAEGTAASSALWAGIAAADTPYLGVLDPTDRLFPDHLSHAMQRFAEEPELDLVYAYAAGRAVDGVLAEQPARLKLSDGAWFSENRGLLDFPLDDARRLLGVAPVPACTFVLRRAKLPAYALDDPHLDAFEIDYLLLMLLSAGARCRCDGRVSAQTDIATSQPPEALAPEIRLARLRSRERIRFRLQNLSLADVPAADAPVDLPAEPAAAAPDPTPDVDVALPAETAAVDANAPPARRRWFEGWRRRPGG